MTKTYYANISVVLEHLLDKSHWSTLVLHFPVRHFPATSIGSPKSASHFPTIVLIWSSFFRSSIFSQPVANGMSATILHATSSSAQLFHGPECSFQANVATNSDNARFPPFRCHSSVDVSPFPLAVAVSVHRCRRRCVSLYALARRRR